MHRAETLYNSGIYQSSADICNSVISDISANIGTKNAANRLLILNYKHMKQYSKALELAYEYIANREHSEDAKAMLYIIYNMYLETRDLDKALTVLQDICNRYNEEMGRTRHLSGAIYYYKRDITTAQDVLLDAINRYPNDKYVADSMYTLAKICSEKKDHSSAIRYIKVLIEKYPYFHKYAELYHYLGMQYAINGDIIEAISALNIAISKYPKYRTADLSVITLGRIYEDAKYCGKAIETYYMIISDYPSSKYRGYANMHISALRNIMP